MLPYLRTAIGEYLYRRGDEHRARVEHLAQSITRGPGEITWTIPYIPATTGVISPPAQTVFQITNTPAVNQVGQTITLLGPADAHRHGCVHELDGTADGRGGDHRPSRRPVRERPAGRSDAIRY